MNSVPSENIIELRKLSNKLCNNENIDIDIEYREVIIEMREIVTSSKIEIEQSTKAKDKVKCYEKMCFTITNLLQKLK